AGTHAYVGQRDVPASGSGATIRHQYGPGHGDREKPGRRIRQSSARGRPYSSREGLALRATSSNSECPRWVISEQFALREPCPLSTPKQTFASVNSMSA